MRLLAAQLPQSGFEDFPGLVGRQFQSLMVCG